MKRNNLYFITIGMSVDFKKYNEKMKSIERGIEQIMNDAIKENKEALEMKKKSEGTITELKKELERQIGEVENKIYMDTRDEMAMIEVKIEEAKMNSNYAIETNKLIDTMKGLIKDQAMMKGQVY